MMMMMMTPQNQKRKQQLRLPAVSLPATHGTLRLTLLLLLLLLLLLVTQSVVVVRPAAVAAVLMAWLRTRSVLPASGTVAHSSGHGRAYL
jgi:hypothetical protein